MFWLVEILGVLLIMGTSLYLFYALAQDVNTSKAVARFDERVTDWLNGCRRPWLDFVMKVITYAGGTIGVTVLTFMLAFYLIDLGRLDDARFSAILVIGGTVLANGLKPWLKRVRPADDDTLISQPRSSSFPSGHSMASMCLALAAIEAMFVSPTPTLAPKILVVLICSIYAVSVGISRIYLGVHWPSDVLAAWLLGTAWITGATGVQLLILHGLLEAGIPFMRNQPFWVR
jgi:undecaprenyl-diphosphatase